MSLAKPLAERACAPGQPEADLAELSDRLSALLNAFARRYPGFELTSLSCDYVVHSDPPTVEYMVNLDLRV